MDLSKDAVVVTVNQRDINMSTHTNTHVTHRYTTNNMVQRDTHTHWEAEARPHVGIGGCHDALKEVTVQDGR